LNKLLGEEAAAIILDAKSKLFYFYPVLPFSFTTPSSRERTDISSAAP
jgi:hypothetical protein